MDDGAERTLDPDPDEVDRPEGGEMLRPVTDRGTYPVGPRTPGAERVGAVRGTITGREDTDGDRTSGMPLDRVDGTIGDDAVGGRTSGLRTEPVVPSELGPMRPPETATGSRAVRLRNGLPVGRPAAGRRSPPPAYRLPGSSSRAASGRTLRNACSRAILSATFAPSSGASAAAIVEAGVVA